MSPNTSGDLGSILGIWAHPDDEAYLSAGLMMHAIADGNRVVCVTATRGEAGFPADDARSHEQRRAIREKELADCLRIIGVTEHRWLDYADGGCANVADDEAAHTLAQIIDEVAPDTILTFGPDGGTGHPDHIAACRWSTFALARSASPARLLYSTKTAQWLDQHFGANRETVLMVEDLQPETAEMNELAVYYSCPDGEWQRKVSALRAQVSQVEPFAQSMGLATYAELVREEFFRAPRPSDTDAIERARNLGASVPE